MRPISSKTRQSIENDVFYQTCARFSEGECDGRITWEHCLTYGGRQIDEPWAIIPLCTFHHAVNEHQDGTGMDKQKNIWIALNRATDSELRQYSKAVDYIKMKERLNKIYGR